MLGRGQAAFHNIPVRGCKHPVCYTGAQRRGVRVLLSAEQGAAQKSEINMKKWGNKHKIRAGLELNEGFGEVKGKRDEAGADPAWIFRRGQQYSVVTCAFASQENEIKELCQSSGW